MSRPTLLCLGLALGLGGCSTPPPQPGNGALDWTADDQPINIETVSDSPTVSLPRDVDSFPSTNAIAGTSSQWIPLARWARESRRGTVTRPQAGPAGSFLLRSPSGVLEIQTRSLAAKWNGVSLRLGFEPQLVNDQPFVHALDLEKNIEPLLRPDPFILRTLRTVVIDPGHGGSASGTRSVLDDSEEKSYTLDWALRLAPLLAAQGWRVYLTRTNDLDLSLTDRVAIADRVRADLFVSLHFNSAAPSQEQSGVETFCLTPTGMPSTLTREFADEVTLTFPNNAFDLENLRLAMRLHRSLLKIGTYVDRGVKRARFLTVLRGQNRPAVLIEAGFLSNPAEARRIADPAFRQKLAEAVADALPRPSAADATPLPVMSDERPPLNGPSTPR